MNMLTNKSTHLTGKFGGRRQQGNTLMPLIIGLAIMVAATLAFLSQGAKLSDQNSKSIAINEITAMLNDTNVEKAAGTTTANLSSASLTATNVFGQKISFDSAKKQIKYVTDSSTVCTDLAAIFKSFKGVSTAACSAAQLDITLK